MSSKGVIILVLIVIAVVVSYFINSNQTQDQVEFIGPEEEFIIEEDFSIDDIDIEIETDEIVLAGSYEEYTSEAVSESLQNGEEVVLFFHASWCPTCRGLDRDVRENVNDIPQGVALFKLDYDDESELKRKYGVVRQHTFVLIDENLNPVKTWAGSSTLQSVISNL